MIRITGQSATAHRTAGAGSTRSSRPGRDIEYGNYEAKRLVLTAQPVNIKTLSPRGLTAAIAQLITPALEPVQSLDQGMQRKAKPAKKT